MLLQDGLQQVRIDAELGSDQARGPGRPVQQRVTHRAGDLVDRGIGLGHIDQPALVLVQRQALGFHLQRELRDLQPGVQRAISLMADVLASGAFDQVITRTAPEPLASAWARQFIEIDRSTDLPLIVTWGSGAERAGEPQAILETRNIPTFTSCRRAIRAMAALTGFRMKADHRIGRPQLPAKPVVLPEMSLPAGSRMLSEHQSKQWLKAYGIRTVEERLLQPDAIERGVDPGLAFPVAVKVDSPDIPHKTEADCVRLNIADQAALRQAPRELLANARNYDPKARVNGLLVQGMASGLEVIVGAIADPSYGPVVVVGLGGIFAEVLKDVRHRFAPVAPDEARAMNGALKGAALFDGYRGRPALDIDALAATISGVSRLIADHEDRIVEIDLNPVFVGPAGSGVVAADALIVLKAAAAETWQKEAASA